MHSSGKTTMSAPKARAWSRRCRDFVPIAKEIADRYIDLWKNQSQCHRIFRRSVNFLSHWPVREERCVTVTGGGQSISASRLDYQTDPVSSKERPCST